MNLLQEIETALRGGELASNPGRCADYRSQLSGEYSYCAGMLEEILKEKPALWNSHRKEFKSDTACEKWWESTEKGIKETILVLKMKRIDKMMSGLNSLIKLAEGQARNQY